MSQAQPHPTPSPRRRARGGRRKSDHSLAAVPELLSRRQRQQQAQASGVSRLQPRRPWKGKLVPFLLGIGLGAGLAGPLPREAGALYAAQVQPFLTSRLAPLLAGLRQGTHGFPPLIDPLGISQRRILVLGSDAVSGNTDVMLTVQVRDGQTRIVQVPRDTFVETPGLGVLKANALYASGGPETAKVEVSRLLSQPVDRYLKLNLEAVGRVAEALGGVEVDVPKRMYYVDNAQGLLIDLQPGRQLLRGRDLEGFLRFRHDEMGDLGRMQRQRLVMAEVFRRLADPATLTRLPALLQIAGSDVHTDLSPIEMTQLVSALGRTKLNTTRLPGRLYWQNDLSYWMPDSNVDHPTGSGEEPQI